MREKKYRKEKTEEKSIKIIELKKQGYKNKDISKIIGIKTNTISYYYKKLGYDKKKIILFCENDWCKSEYKVPFTMYDKEIHNKCEKCRKYEKICSVCNKPHNNQGLTCCKKCADILRKESYFESCGTEHNFYKKSKSRIEWEKRLFEQSGITNIFQSEKIKEKIKQHYIDNYGVEYNTQLQSYWDKRRELGIFIPLEDLTKYQIYRNSVISFTNFNLKMFGDNKFGKGYEKERGYFKNHIDHILSIKQGFLENIEPYIVGSIVNLQLIPYKDNLSKHDNSGMTKKCLYEKYKLFETDNKELIDKKIKTRILYENKKNNKEEK